MRLRRSLASLIALSLMTTGCVPTKDGEGNGMTTRAVEERAEQILRATKDVLGESGWTPHPTWVGCDAQGRGLVQLLFFVERLKPMEGDLGALSEKVAEKWAGLGLVARAQPVSDRPGTYVVSDPPFLQGAKQDGTLTQLQFSATFSGLQVLSPCVEGDLAQLNSPQPTLTPPSSP